jgi:hypothetical protein
LDICGSYITEVVYLINLYLIANHMNHLFMVFCVLADGFYYNVNFHCKCIELEEREFDLQLCITCMKNTVIFGS